MVSTATITWMVLARDVTGTISVRGVGGLAAVVILDVDTGLVRGVAVEESTDAALRHAVTSALTRPAAELPSGPPGRVLTGRGLGARVRRALAAAGAGERAVIEEVQPGPDAEDIFDAFLGHMSGRTQPTEFPTPEDWRLLLAQAAKLHAAEPWTRWSDEQDLVIELQLPTGTAAYTAVVMGQAGIQHGLALYPGEHLPPGVRNPAGSERAMPAGTLLFLLDPAEGVPRDVTDKAIRYGWPESDDLVPAFMAFTSAGPAEIGREDVHRLIAGIAGILAVDRRGPTPVEVAGRPISGSVSIGDRQRIRYSVRHLPPREAQEQALRLHLAGHDLLPPDTAVTVGHVGWDALSDLRASSHVYRPAPPDAPPPTGREVPLVVLSPHPGDGRALAARIAQLDPYGVSPVDTGDGQRVLVLAGGAAAEVLIQLPAGHPAIAAFERRLRQTKGRQVIMVADAASASGDGLVYGVFECHQPLASPATKEATRRAGAAVGTTRLRVTMREVVPLVERIVDVPAGITLDELHDVLQVAIGWTDSHLHRFETEAVSYSQPSEDWAEDEVDERGVRLSSLPPRLAYAYDFGDNWEHDVEVLGAGGPEPGCVGGEGSCPPEDCGGTYGYAELLEALHNPRHREHRDMRAWVGDRLRPFDLTATDAKVRAVVGQVPDSVRILLDLAADGVKLTPGGRLPRVIVRAVQERRPAWHSLGRPASIEEDLAPLSFLHDMLRRVGVLRLAKGVLRPTKAAGDEREIVRRIRCWFVDGSFDLVVAERVVALLVARGPMSDAELAAGLFTMLRQGWRRGEDPVTELDVRRAIWHLSAELKALDMITTERERWSAGMSALTVLPRVALLTDVI